MRFLLNLFRKPVNDTAHDQPYGDWPSDAMLDRALNSERTLPRSGSGVASPLRDTGASFSPVAPALLSNLFNHLSGN